MNQRGNLLINIKNIIYLNKVWYVLEILDLLNIKLSANYCEKQLRLFIWVLIIII